MAIKNIIAQGIGFVPGSVRFMPTLGFTVGTEAPVVAPLPPNPQRTYRFQGKNRTGQFNNKNRSLI